MIRSVRGAREPPGCEVFVEGAKDGFSVAVRPYLFS